MTFAILVFAGILWLAVSVGRYLAYHRHDDALGALAALAVIAAGFITL